MSKSRRQHAHSRKLESLHRDMDKLLAEEKERESRRPPTEKTSAEVECERVWSERFKSMLTPEYLQAMDESLAHMRRMHHQMESLTDRLTHQLRQYKRSGLGSYRTKRLRKKMQTHREKELQARGL